MERCSREQVDQLIWVELFRTSPTIMSSLTQLQWLSKSSDGSTLATNCFVVINKKY